VRDLQTATALVSTGSNGIGNGQSDCAPAISGDQAICVYGLSTNLVPGGTNGNYQSLCVYRLVRRRRDIGVGGQSNQHCYGVSIAPMDAASHLVPAIL
jgi:hypothetical protein